MNELDRRTGSGQHSNPAIPRTPRLTIATAASRRLLGAAAAVMLIGAIAACGPATDTNPPASQGVGAPSPAPYALTTIDGRQVSVPGSAPTALLFFSFSCGECVGGGKSLARAEATAQETGSKAGFLLVDIDPNESAQDAARFREQIDGTNLPAVIDTGATLSHTYKISAPTTVIIVDPAGKVTYRGQAPAADQILEQLDKAAAK